MFNPSRDDVRQMFFTVWRAYREGLPLAGMDALALEVILQHPEYHGTLEHPERARDKDYLEESNPFLHMSLHMALEEQLSIDQPPGIRDAWGALLRRRAGERHAALHEALECLAETMWRSQRDAMPPDAALYLSCIERRGRT